MESASLKFLLLKIEFLYNTFLVINYEPKKKNRTWGKSNPRKQVESWFVNKSRAATLFFCKAMFKSGNEIIIRRKEYDLCGKAFTVRVEVTSMKQI